MEFKKVLSYVSILFVLVLLVGCTTSSQQGAASNSVSDNSQGAQSPISQPPALEDQQAPEQLNTESNIPTFEAAPTEQLPEGFAAKFRSCKPAILESTLVQGLTYRYEILGLSVGLCSVKSEFLANPNPAFVGPTMECGYDNSKDFQTAVQDMSSCYGGLYQLMTGG